jgi:MFS transporter, OFA family, oxalate/formate antiporter
VASFIGVTFGASPVPFNVFPVVLGPIHAQSGWDFTAISVGFSIFGVIASLLAPVFGALCDRFGVRPVALLSMVAFALTFGSFYLLPDSLGGYWALWALLGIVGIGSTPLTFSRAVNMWFTRNRGLALGIMLLGTSAAAMVVPQLAQTIVAASNWRTVFPVVALLPLLIALPIGLLWLREPRPEERPVGVADAQGRLTGVTLVQALRGYRFWVLLLAVFAIAVAYAGVQLNIVQIAELHGLSPRAAAGVLTLVALGILASRVLIGFLFDRLWAPAVAFPAMLVTSFACWMLVGTSGGLVPVILGGFLLGFAAGAESDIIAYFAARYFGMAYYCRIYGTFYMAFGIGSSISPILYGMVRDRTGGYDPILMADILLFAASGAALLLLGRYPVSVAGTAAALAPAEAR